MIDRSEIGGVILAGGKASRMDFRDKALQPLFAKPLLEHVIGIASPQVEKLALSVNHNIDRYQRFALPIVSDDDSSYAGPLLGILSALKWYRSAREGRGINYLACFPADVPEFPSDVVCQLAAGIEEHAASVAYITHREQIQPLFSLWKLELLEAVEKAVADGLYGPKLLFDSLASAAVDCSTENPAAFYNVNRLEDLEQASQLLGK
ncbi:MAG: molybdenum cofactor guanylyltransferase [Pseudohongiella sp.]|nr:MAG: molybdenum cofactor guanylyltransferase [Pseudohongiella sp.]